MEPRERRHEPLRPQAGSGEGADGGDLGQVRSMGQDFLAAGDDAIRRALSGDSEAFLRANRQRGGQ